MDYRVRMSKDGRLVIPAAIRKQLNLQDNSLFILKLNDTTIELMPMAQAIKKAQVLVAPYKKIGHSIVDEFLQERRELSRYE